MSAQDVVSIIASASGGYNGDVPGKSIEVEVISDVELIYSLTHVNFVDEFGSYTPVEPPVVERFRVTLVPIESDEPTGL